MGAGLAEALGLRPGSTLAGATRGRAGAALPGGGDRPGAAGRGPGGLRPPDRLAAALRGPTVPGAAARPGRRPRGGAPRPGALRRRAPGWGGRPATAASSDVLAALLRLVAVAVTLVCLHLARPGARPGGPSGAARSRRCARRAPDAPALRRLLGRGGARRRGPAALARRSLLEGLVVRSRRRARGGGLRRPTAARQPRPGRARRGGPGGLAAGRAPSPGAARRRAGGRRPGGGEREDDAARRRTAAEALARRRRARGCARGCGVTRPGLRRSPARCMDPDGTAARAGPAGAPRPHRPRPRRPPRAPRRRSPSTDPARARRPVARAGPVPRPARPSAG